MGLRTKITGLLAGLGATTASTAAWAQTLEMRGDLPILGAPQDRRMSFQEAATAGMQDIVALDNLLLVIITAIVLFVTGLLIYSMVRHNARANPEPATFSHNTPIEVTWTLVPLFILFFIGAFSLPVLFKQQTIPEGDVVIKATGYQWYWGYEYPEHGIDYLSFMLEQEELADYGYSPDEYLLATDTAMVVPTGQTIVVQVTAADVIHSWTIPAFGVKQDGVPGRLAELHFTINEGAEGIYFGQCSELCGVNHAYMPITVFAVTPEEYEAWVAGEATAFNSIDARAPQVLQLAAAE